MPKIYINIILFSKGVTLLPDYFPFHCFVTCSQIRNDPKRFRFHPSLEQSAISPFFPRSLNKFDDRYLGERLLARNVSLVPGTANFPTGPRNQLKRFSGLLWREDNRWLPCGRFRPSNFPRVWGENSPDTICSRLEVGQMKPKNYEPDKAAGFIHVYHDRENVLRATPLIQCSTRLCNA